MICFRSLQPLEQKFHSSTTTIWSHSSRSKRVTHLVCSSEKIRHNQFTSSAAASALSVFYTSHRLSWNDPSITNIASRSKQRSTGTTYKDYLNPLFIVCARPCKPIATPFSTSSIMASESTWTESPIHIKQDSSEVNELVKTLEAGTKKSKSSGWSCKQTSFPVQNSQITVNSWKFQDWDYKKRDLPTYARGLFTCRNSKTGNYEIAIRGYDKFFNISEVHKTKWEHIEENTKGPYELTLKENGCIIFISGLVDGTLLVCSKHSTGPRKEVLSHSVAGERWVDKQLAGMGKGREEFAKYLYDANITAVAELCDDSFEEHILAYTEENAGLYLHGVNLNLPTFTTWAGKQVQSFADQWGFKKIEYLYKDDVKELRTFLEECAETGSYNGRDVEGFVIRCKARDGPNATNYYDWFFKYKFDEPYLMYRQWREVTKAIIAQKQPKYRNHKAITEEYIKYARAQLKEHRELASQYQKNHGIIAMRDGFLAERGVKGRDIIQAEEAEMAKNGSSKISSLVLVPVATIGCGKTTVAFALTKLFGWGHIQNDNITTKKNKPQAFANEVCREIEDKVVCIADRNNHQKRERKQIIDDISVQIPDAKFVALHYVHHIPGQQSMEAIRNATRARVFARGDAHQTIHAQTNDEKFITGIMEGFLGRFEPVDIDSPPDDAFDAVIDLHPLVDSRKNLEHIINELYSLYPDLVEEWPSAQDMDDAIDSALREYSPDIKHTIGNKTGSSSGVKPVQQGSSKQNSQKSQQQQPKTKQPAVEYFAVKLDSETIRNTLDKTFKSQTATVQKFYNHLQNSRRIQPNFHITMMHRASVKQNPELWQHYSDLNKSLQPGKTFIDNMQVHLERVVWDSRIMAIIVSFVGDNEHQCSNDVAHITIGTGAADIKPKESNDLLNMFMSVGSGGDTGIEELPIGKEGVGIVLEGRLEVVMARS